MSSVIKNKSNLVVIVDDDVTLTFVNKRLLEIHKISQAVITFDSGRKAIDFLIARDREGGLLPDFILLDLIMPELSGLEFLKVFSNLSERIRKTCRIFILSASESAEEINEARSNSYVSDYFIKPLSVNNLKILKEAVGLKDKAVH
jgi:response regulator of citrate/malate metabolism